MPIYTRIDAEQRTISALLSEEPVSGYGTAGENAAHFGLTAVGLRDPEVRSRAT